MVVLYLEVDFGKIYHYLSNFLALVVYFTLKAFEFPNTLWKHVPPGAEKAHCHVRGRRGRNGMHVDCPTYDQPKWFLADR